MSSLPDSGTRAATGTNVQRKKLFPRKADAMIVSENRFKQSYTESEAALMLGISIHTLRTLLDEHVFNDGSERPPELTLRASDLVLLRFWHKSRPNPKVLRMPRRA